MLLEARPAELLEELLQLKRPSVNQLMELRNLSRRQVTYDLGKINDWLEDRRLPPIQFKGARHLEVPETVREHVRTHEIIGPKRGMVFSEEERRIFIYLYLFIRSEPISAAHLIQLLQVSRNTVLADVKKANDTNTHFLIRIHYTRQNGYHLKGTEFDKRALVMHHLSRLLQMPNGEKMIEYLLNEEGQPVPFAKIRTVLQELERAYTLEFVEERVNQFAFFLLFYYFRQREGKLVLYHADEIEAIKKDPMWQAAEKLIDQLGFAKKETEICYFTIQLLGLSLGKDEITDSDLLFTLCGQLVADFESKACIAFEKRDVVIKSLYQHVKPAYFRMKYRIPVHNPLLDQIRREHKALYTIVKEVMGPIGVLLGITIPEEEIGFITIHFGALLEKPRKAMPKKKRALVVCPSGISSSLMVKHQLQSLFSEINIEKTVSLQEFGEGDFAKNYDLIFSTVVLKHNQPYFHVKPIMTPIEKNNLVNEVYRHLFGIRHHELSPRELIQVIGQFADVFDENGLKEALSRFSFQKKVDGYRGIQPVLRDLLTNQTIQVADKVSDWEEAIKVAADPLLVKGVIERSYIDAMIENVKTMGPYVVIGPEVAIPHARPETGVNEVGMSFLQLREPVHFLGNEDYPVRLLFCIAAIDNSTHLKALSQLTKLLSQKENIDKLKQLTTAESILELINEYSA